MPSGSEIEEQDLQAGAFLDRPSNLLRLQNQNAIIIAIRIVPQRNKNVQFAVMHFFFESLKDTRNNREVSHDPGRQYSQDLLTDPW